MENNEFKVFLLPVTHKELLKLPSAVKEEIEKQVREKKWKILFWLSWGK